MIKIIDTNSRSYKHGISWLTRQLIRYLEYRGVISSKEYADKCLELEFWKGHSLATKEINDIIKREML